MVQTRRVMIARVRFEGIVKDGKKKAILPDFIDIHVPPESLDLAKSTFEHWLDRNSGVKGNSGVFHPINEYGSIKVKSIEEKK
jgi:hypothetical protein